MKKKNLKNLKLNKKSISGLSGLPITGGNTNNSINICIRTFVNQNGINICLESQLYCQHTKNGCLKTNEVDANTLAIC